MAAFLLVYVYHMYTGNSNLWYYHFAIAWPGAYSQLPRKARAEYPRTERCQRGHRQHKDENGDPQYNAQFNLQTEW